MTMSLKGINTGIYRDPPATNPDPSRVPRKVQYPSRGHVPKPTTNYSSQKSKPSFAATYQNLPPTIPPKCPNLQSRQSTKTHHQLVLPNVQTFVRDKVPKPTTNYPSQMSKPSFATKYQNPPPTIPPKSPIHTTRPSTKTHHQLSFTKVKNIAIPCLPILRAKPSFTELPL